MEFLLAGLGLIILLFAGDALVRGAVNTSLRLGVPALIVGLTIVAFGTSAPELLISVRAVLDNAPGLALGNVIGSNIANVLLVLGIPALISGLHMADCSTRRSFFMMIAATVLFMVLSLLGPITWLHALVLLGGLALVLGDQFRDALAHRRNGAAAEAEAELEGADPQMRWPKILMFLGLGLVGLPLGAEMLVNGATSIALRFGVSDAIIGLTLVAIGTSLPELSTTVMAALRRQADVALGNVIGSNIFNLLAIIGITGLVGDIPVDPEFLRFDIWVMLASALILGPFAVRGWSMTKRWGILFVGLYAVYLMVVIAL